MYIYIRIHIFIHIYIYMYIYILTNLLSTSIHSYQAKKKKTARNKR